MLREIRFAVRSLVRSRGFALTALITLALGIGANTAVFSVVRGVLLRPLPFPEPERLVTIREVSSQARSMDVAWRNFLDWRGASAFAGLAAHSRGWPTTVLGAGEPQRVSGSAVSRGFFGVLGVQPFLGRGFVEAEHVQGGAPAVIVSHAWWRTRLGEERDLSRLSLNVGGFDARVVGVMPPGFAHPAGVDLWFPLELQEQSEHRTAHNYVVLGRLGGGATLEQARAQLDAITATFADEPGVRDEEWFADFFPVRTEVTALHTAIVGDTARALWVLLGAAGMVLLVACTNLASATLARGTGREREMAIRRAIGADRRHLIRLLFVESLTLSLAGGALGVLLAAAFVRALPALAPGQLPRLDAIRLDAAVLAFAALAAVATAAAFGLLPALRRFDAGTLLRGGAASDPRRLKRVWSGLIGLEVALALVLLIGSGLLLRSFAAVLSEEPGFRSEAILLATISPPASKYADGAARARYYDALLARVAALPAVAEAGLVTSPPMAGVSNGLVDVRGGPRPAVTGEYQVASAGYFRALDIPIVRGRAFDDRVDREGAAPVVIVNESFARLAWPGDDPIGKQMTGGGMDDYWESDVWATVVGVAADIRQRELSAEPSPTFFFPYRQRPYRTWQAVLTIRPTRGGAGALAGPIRDLVRAVDRDVPVEISTIEDRIGGSLAERRFLMLLLGAFAAVALVLAAVGIQGVVAYAVARRTREVGIRLALGAEPRQVRRLVQRDSLLAAAAGAALGVLAALVLTRLLAGLLYGISPTDPATIGLVIAVMAAVAWGAGFVPARRTAHVDPMRTMRTD